jgi:predicted deacylase
MNNQTLRVGTLTASPGHKVYGVADFMVQGQPYRLPMWLIHGDAAGPTLVVTAGVHPAEYASIAAALEFARSLEPTGLRGRVIVVPVMNMPAFTARSIYVCPLDGKNLNRVFPGDAHGTASEQIAAWVFEHVIRQADFFVDLHGGDLIEALVPFTIFFRSGDARVDEASLELAKAFGIDWLVCSETPGSTFSSASRAGIPAILTEAGGQGIWTAEDVGRHTGGLRRVLKHLGMHPGGPPDAAACTVLSQFRWLRSEHDGFWYPAVAVGAMVSEGQETGCVKDWEGRVLQRAIADVGGRVLFIVSSLAINRGDPLLAVGA